MVERPFERAANPWWMKWRDLSELVAIEP
jgi:hypothetical protein